MSELPKYSDKSSPLPGWVQRFGAGAIIPCDDPRTVDMRMLRDYEKTVEALSIAWEALNVVAAPHNKECQGCQQEAMNAMRRIASLGGDADKSAIEELGK